MIYIIFNEYFLNEDIQKYSSLVTRRDIKFINIFWKKKYLGIRCIRKIGRLLGMSKLFLNYAELKKIKLNKEDKVIYFDFTDKKTLKILRKYTNKNLEIFWLWNKVKEKDIEYLKKISKNIWTFDNRDKEKFKLKYTSQFYWRKMKENSIIEDKNRVFFIGVDKGRIKRIDEIVNTLGLYGKILIQKEKFKIYPSRYKKYLLLKNKKYIEVLKEIEKSGILLEICKKNQVGITLRTLEALFFNKKLITNNLNIKNYDFYDESNIFIVEDEKKIDIKSFQKFLLKEKKNISEDILRKYTIEYWLEEITK